MTEGYFSAMFNEAITYFPTNERNLIVRSCSGGRVPNCKRLNLAAALEVCGGNILINSRCACILNPSIVNLQQRSESFSMTPSSHYNRFLPLQPFSYSDDLLTFQLANFPGRHKKEFNSVILEEIQTGFSRSLTNYFMSRRAVHDGISQEFSR